MLHVTRPTWFFKSHRNRPRSNPLHRWLYAKALGVASVVGLGGMYLSYYRCRAGASHDGHLCSSGTLEILPWLPFALCSRFLGELASSPAIPPWVHQRAIEAYAAFFSVDLSECIVPPGGFPTFDAFIARELRRDARPISSDPGTVMVSPVDGTVLACGVTSCQEGSNTKIVSVKGAEITLQNLFRTSFPPLAEGKQRHYISFLLRAGDYHHVHAPCDAQLMETIVIPGQMYPVTLSGFRWIPRLVSTNERVSLRWSTTTTAPQGSEDSRQKRGDQDTVTTTKTAGDVWMALVGGMIRGRIEVKLEPRVKTNLANPPEYAVHLGRSGNMLESGVVQRGDDIARFRWGSAVVMVVDVDASVMLCVAPGDVVRVGQRLLVSPSSTERK